ncbi:hypothetical protein Vadar_010778 [Vaccinium darrowii]|uniref:Uncharacterized protein n=1 Tax=Vaccinium darrowii TaxID=229202 RepID=A0ACB7YWM5_9ERIC|nr:hypothetical protein Vadar_010778 [Vaccinium darrowii]
MSADLLVLDFIQYSSNILLMAEDKIAIPLNPEKSEVKSNHRRRNSTGNLSISKEGLKILPRYLRASFGSCHDFCKYRIEDCLEKKVMSPIPRGITERSSKGQDEVKDAILEERKKKSLVKPKALPDYKRPTNDKHHQVIKKEAQVSPKNVSSKRFSLPGNIMDISAKYIADVSSKPLQIKPSSLLILGNVSSRRCSQISMSNGVKVLQESPVGGSRSGGNSDINTSKAMRMPKLRKKEDFVPPAAYLSSKPSIKRELSAKSGHVKDLKKLSSVKSQDYARKAECKKAIDEYIPEKMLYVIETKPQNPTENVSDATCFSQSLSPSSEEKKLECDRNGIYSSRSPPSIENNQLRHSRNVGHATRPSSPSSLYSNKNSFRLTQNGNRNTPSSESVSESIKSDQSDPFCRSAIKPKRVGLDDKVGSPEKINFRRGKVDDVLSKNTIPRKLGFQQRRVLCENQNGETYSEPRSLKELVAVDELSGSKTEPIKVVLRHRDVEGKKWGQNLLNNVIEETASKLVQARKSKVRALVDAFETVILLHDTKSSATTNAH